MPDKKIEILQNHVSSLADVAGEQALLLQSIADQLRALMVVNAAFIGESHDIIEMDLVRKKALAVFSDPKKDAAASSYVLAMLGPIGAKIVPPAQGMMKEEIGSIDRSNFHVIDGGKEDS